MKKVFNLNFKELDKEVIDQIAYALDVSDIPEVKAVDALKETDKIKGQAAIPGRKAVSVIEQIEAKAEEMFTKEVSNLILYRKKREEREKLDKKPFTLKLR